MSIIYLSQEMKNCVYHILVSGTGKLCLSDTGLSKKENCVYHILVSGKGKLCLIIYLSQVKVNCVYHIIVSGKGKLCPSYTCLAKR